MMKKKAYINPELHVVVLQHSKMLAASDPYEVSSNLPSNDNLHISDEEAGTGFWGR